MSIENNHAVKQSQDDRFTEPGNQASSFTSNGIKLAS